MKDIKAGETDKKEPDLLHRIIDRFTYQVKKMEVIAGHYDIKQKIAWDYHTYHNKGFVDEL